MREFKREIRLESAGIPNDHLAAASVIGCEPRGRRSFARDASMPFDEAYVARPNLDHRTEASMRHSLGTCGALIALFGLSFAACADANPPTEEAAQSEADLSFARGLKSIQKRS
jgi:hypothetical protein